MIVTSQSDLPVYNHALGAKPSDLLTGPLEPVLALADQIIAYDAQTLHDHEIRDRTTLEGIIGHRIAAALLRRDAASVKADVDRLRDLQDREDRKLCVGLIEEIAAEAATSPHPPPVAAREAQSRFGALPYETVSSWMNTERAKLTMVNPDFVVGRAGALLDTFAEKNGGVVDQQVAAEIVNARVALDRLCPIVPELLDAMARMADGHRDAAASDIWGERQVTLWPTAKAHPVTIAIWDSGVDLTLFTPARDPGMAIDPEARPAAELLRPAGEYAGRLPQLFDLLKGLFDLRAGQATADAAAYQAHVASLKPAEVKDFGDALGFASTYVHGTHVAGIASEGNPFARIQSISMHLPYRIEDMKLDRTISERRAAFYARAVQRMQAAGARVANMSWRIGPAILESMLAAQGGIADANERKRVAAELFANEKQALDEAIGSAPEILFVAGAGNEGNDSGFSEYIPAGLSAPNLITVGAVDRSGCEAVFTSVGGTVAIYANGVDIEAFIPGGGRRAYSGTSMASPQVANAAAKLVAMRPELTGPQLRRLLLDTADTVGRVKLLNPKAAFEKTGLLRQAQGTI